MRGPTNYHYVMTGCIGSTVIAAIGNDSMKDKQKQTTVFTPTQAGMLEEKVRSLDLFNDASTGSPLRKALSTIHDGPAQLLIFISLINTETKDEFRTLMSNLITAGRPLM